MTQAIPMPSYHYLRGKRFEAHYKGMVKTCFWCLKSGKKCKNYVLGNGNPCKVSGAKKANFKQYISNLWTNIGWNGEQYDRNDESSQPAIQSATSLPANDQNDLAIITEPSLPKMPDDVDHKPESPLQRCILEPMISPEYLK